VQLLPRRHTSRLQRSKPAVRVGHQIHHPGAGVASVDVVGRKVFSVAFMAGMALALAASLVAG